MVIRSLDVDTRRRISSLRAQEGAFTRETEDMPRQSIRFRTRLAGEEAHRRREI